jgi:hypothetical protein
MPKLKKLWASYHEAYDVDVVVVPTLPTTARPIDDAQPYFTHNGRKVQSSSIPAYPAHSAHCAKLACMRSCNSLVGILI